MIWIILAILYAAGFFLQFRWFVHYHARKWSRWLAWDSSDTIMTIIMSLIWPVFFLGVVVPEMEFWSKIPKLSFIKRWHDRVAKEYQ